MNVFFAVDGSAESLAAVRQVGQLLSPATDAVAFYFAPPDVIVRHSTTAKEMQERALRSIADEVFAEAKRYLPEPLAAKATKIISRHAPREGILAESEAWNAHLIVLGARGISGLDRVLLGSVSRAVASRSSLPVLISRPAVKHAGAEPFRVLYACDAAGSGTAALKTVQKLALPAPTIVTAVTVMETLPAELPQWLAPGRRSPETEEMIARWEQELERDKKQAHDKLASFVRLQEPPFDRAEVVVAEGHAAEQILKLVDSLRIDLVVMGSGGKGMLERFFLGSTSEKVLTHAPCSVLIARDA